MFTEPITGIVLAGGRSRRMGSDKAVMVLNGKPMLQYSIDAIRPFCDKLVISSNKDSYDFTSCEIWPDLVPGEAAMVGIYSCLKRSETDFNIVLSCDMPLVSKALFEYMLQRVAEAEIILPVHGNNQMEPLCAIYKRSLLPRFEHAIASEEFGLHDFIRAGSYLPVRINEALPFYNHSMFSNINTLEEFEKLTWNP
jgi:molybdenum cofactor guanylyltransferase